MKQKEPRNFAVEGKFIPADYLPAENELTVLYVDLLTENLHLIE